MTQESRNDFLQAASNSVARTAVNLSQITNCTPEGSHKFSDIRCWYVIVLNWIIMLHFV